MRSRCRRRCTRNRTAPPNRVAPPAPPVADATVTNAAFDSRARPVSRTATAREIGGAESSTTSENAALRSSTSAHHAAFAASGGRTIQKPMSVRSAQSHGASVRDASTYATHSPRSIAADTTRRSNDSVPVAPITSVNRPRGRPYDARARSSASIPVGIPGVCGNGAGRSARTASRRTTADESRRLTLETGRWAVSRATAVLTTRVVAGFKPCPNKHRKHGE